jgi:uncharacterized protein
MGRSHLSDCCRVPICVSPLLTLSGIFFFTGPVLLILTTIFEFFLGNFFPMMVCGLFAVFWLSFGVLQLPEWQIAASYSTTGSAAAGAASVGYNSAIALYLIVWGFALTTFFFFTLRTNTVFALIFGFVSVAAFVLSAAYWKVASGDYGPALELQKVSQFYFTRLLKSRLEEPFFSLSRCWDGT